ncbi:MAG: hypothetical protein Q9218_004587 [Villophora microphyllina]
MVAPLGNYDEAMDWIDAIRYRGNLHLDAWLHQRPKLQAHYDNAICTFHLAMSIMTSNTEKFFTLPYYPGYLNLCAARRQMIRTEIARTIAEKRGTTDADLENARSSIVQDIRRTITTDEAEALAHSHLCAIAIRRKKYLQAIGAARKASKLMPNNDEYLDLRFKSSMLWLDQEETKRKMALMR